jgi:hypothetical protein
MLHSFPSTIDNREFSRKLEKKFVKDQKKLFQNGQKNNYQDLHHFKDDNSTPDDAHAQITEIGQKLTGFFELEFAPIVLELKLKDNIFYCIEAVCEVGGEYLADYLIPVCVGYPWFENLIRMFTRNWKGIKAPDSIPFKSGIPGKTNSAGIIGFSFFHPEYTPAEVPLNEFILNPDKYSDFYHQLSENKNSEKMNTRNLSGNKDRSFVYGMSHQTTSGLLKKLDQINFY